MGILDAAGVNVTEIADDPFGFGNEHWPVEVMEVGKTKISDSGKQYGMMVKFKCVHPDYESMKFGLGSGQWWQLPSPKDIRSQLVEQPSELELNVMVQNWVRFIKVLGFADEVLGKVDAADIVGKRCMAKIKASLNEEFGNYGFRVFGMKEMPSEGTVEGMSVFSKATQEASKAPTIKAPAKAATGENLNAFESALAKNSK